MKAVGAEAIALIFVGTLAATACGSSDESTGSGSSEQVVPSCLRELFAQCPTEGACQSASTGADNFDCYASGVRVDSTNVELNCNVSTTGFRGVRVRVLKPDGALCYSFERGCDCGSACEVPHIWWYSAGGDLVAQRATDRANQSVYCLEKIPDGFSVSETVPCGDSNDHCGLSPKLEGCSPGSCP